MLLIPFFASPVLGFFSRSSVLSFVNVVNVVNVANTIDIDTDINICGGGSGLLLVGLEDAGL